MASFTLALFRVILLYLVPGQITHLVYTWVNIDTRGHKKPQKVQKIAVGPEDHPLGYYQKEHNDTSLVSKVASGPQCTIKQIVTGFNSLKCQNTGFQKYLLYHICF